MMQHEAWEEQRERQESELERPQEWPQEHSLLRVQAQAWLK